MAKTRKSENRLSIRKREHIITRLTVFEEYILKFKAQYNKDQIPDNQATIELESRIDTAIDLLKDFENVHFQIEVEDSEIHNNELVFNEFETKYYEIIALAKDVLSHYKSKPIDKLPNLMLDESMHSCGSTSHVNHAKLPEIPLPKFGGGYDSWLEFKNTFISLIHEKVNIPLAMKLHYLRCTLQGPPAELIKSVDFAPEHYNTAWNLLCERYDNTKLLVHNHIKAMVKMESFTTESATKIRKMVDDISKHMKSLMCLKEPVQQWDSLLIFILSEKIPGITLQQWEMKQSSKASPTLTDFLEFLKQRATFLETIEHKTARNTTNTTNKNETRSSDRTVKSFVSSNYKTCMYCDKEHFIYNCSEFLKLAISERLETARKKGLCINCLRKEHLSKDCKSGSCRKCNKPHNTLLHFDNSKSNPEQSTSVKSTVEAQTVNGCCNSQNSTQQILLSTAMIQIFDSKKQTHTVTALLDSGSQSNFMTNELYKKLQLPGRKIDMSVIGINNVKSNLNLECHTTIQSTRGDAKSKLSFLIVPEIVNELPYNKFDRSELNIPVSLRLADPNFNIPHKIDVLIGAEHFWQSLCIGNIKLGQNRPIMQKTIYGWIISGPVKISANNKVHCNFVQNMDIQSQLQQFWALEECSNNVVYSKEEINCDNHFMENVSRKDDGRFIVKIPFKESISLLGDSRQQAVRRFLSLEKRLQSNSKLQESYLNFMKEYEELHHMSRINESACNQHQTNFYLPHHAVFKERSTTTKLRVVFDGSAKSESGYSINDIQMVGPTIQNDLLSILLRFRKHNYVLSADIAKMYRQVLIQHDDRNYQRILWRYNPEDEISCFELNTVTYGTAAASFLAIRCLYYLADQHEKNFQEASEIIKTDFYVDDLLTGSDTIENLKKIKSDITHVLRSGKFELRKWSSNNLLVLDDDTSQERVQFSNESKTLGITWFPKTDELSFDIKPSKPHTTVTKRIILFTVAQIFDPLGLLAPVIITVKILMQKLWKEKYDWDESVSQEIHTQWIKFAKEAPHLSNLRIPRHAFLQNHCQVELHGFSDASNEAYGGCVYVRTINEHGESKVQLLAAKAKVAPVKQLTTPKLELCGAVVLTKLINKIQDSMNFKSAKIICWTDSTILLAWLKMPPNKLKIFVKNRVAFIQENSDTNNWRHVPTQINPADLLSRGIKPDLLLNCNLWWHRPEWLNKSENYWPEINPQLNKRDLPELQNTVIMCVAKFDLEFPISNFSDFNKLKRIMSYCLRFIKNCTISKENRILGPLSTSELLEGTKKLIQISQGEHFAEQLKLLKNNKPLLGKDKLISLNPFVDKDGILRVGGRIENSPFRYEQKHPAILHHKHHLTHLIFQSEHKLLLHAGPKALLCSIRLRYWPIGGQNLSKKICRECVTCVRYNTKVINPLMGNLPASRTTPMLPFQISGVDYAGPFLINDKRGRGSRKFKCYISLFVCFCTKAIHLELVSDLTKDSFIAAFRRFVARRGKPSHVYSDNGTTFVGANSELNELGKFILKNYNELTDSYSVEGVQWHFIPARAPHFGGLWEAGVKSTKFHLKRVNASLTFEDFNTLIIQIEAILNSRPITPLSTSPDDSNPLTPAHFLIGRAFSDLPDPALQHLQSGKLSNFQRVQQLKQNFWRRWSKEYISELQQRCKWRQQQHNIKIGTMVLIKEDNVHPSRWLLGRVVELHPGNDNIVRVISIRTSRGIIKRSTVKICPLPIDTSEN